ncbi:gamma-aminobutyric acid receptor alpha-like [Dreissena polymorpha]|nr:gamma-aminobutyric acid receptor alpha-like [Dreissena polymorpha]
MSLQLDKLLLGYDKRLRPGYGEKPLVVQTDILVRSMGPVSEKNMDYSMDCYFRQLWVDKRLALNVSMANISLNIKMLERLWYPDTVFLNGGKSYVHMVPMPNKFFRIHKDGTVLYSQRLTIRASCIMRLEKYPLDSQTCHLYVASFAYSVEDVIYEWRFGRKNSVEIAADMTLSQFDILQTPCFNTTMPLRGASHSVLTVQFYLRRHMGFFLINVYVPCCLLVVLSWVSFWINREATSDRIALGTMVVLTMTFIGLDNRNDLPRVSYSTALDVYVAFCFFFVLATIIQFASVHYYTKFGCGEGPQLVMCISKQVELEQIKEDQEDAKSTDTVGENSLNRTKVVVPNIQRESMLFKCWNCFFGTRNVRHNRMFTNVLGLNSVSKIDKLSRIIFPIVFLLFNILYWCTYLTD